MFKLNTPLSAVLSWDVYIEPNVKSQYAFQVPDRAPVLSTVPVNVIGHPDRTIVAEPVTAQPV
jgi:hypothetical protein